LDLNVPQKTLTRVEEWDCGMISVSEPKTRGFFIREKVGGPFGGASSIYLFNKTAEAVNAQFEKVS
jgi:hypothetical protein